MNPCHRNLSNKLQLLTVHKKDRKARENAYIQQALLMPCVRCLIVTGIEHPRQKGRRLRTVSSVFLDSSPFDTDPGLQHFSDCGLETSGADPDIESSGCIDVINSKRLLCCLGIVGMRSPVTSGTNVFAMAPRNALGCFGIGNSTL